MEKESLQYFTEKTLLERELLALQSQRLGFINAGLSGGFEYSKVADWANEEFGIKIIMAEQRIEDLKRLNRNV